MPNINQSQKDFLSSKHQPKLSSREEKRAIALGKMMIKAGLGDCDIEDIKAVLIKLAKKLEEKRIQSLPKIH